MKYDFTDDSYDLFIHILMGCFTSIGTNVHEGEIILQDMGKFDKQCNII